LLRLPFAALYLSAEAARASIEAEISAAYDELKLKKKELMTEVASVEEVTHTARAEGCHQS
jgi:hypothetical protein